MLDRNTLRAKSKIEFQLEDHGRIVANISNCGLHGPPNAYLHSVSNNRNILVLDYTLLPIVSGYMINFSPDPSRT